MAETKKKQQKRKGNKKENIISSKDQQKIVLNQDKEDQLSSILSEASCSSFSFSSKKYQNIKTQNDSDGKM